MSVCLCMRARARARVRVRVCVCVCACACVEIVYLHHVIRCVQSHAALFSDWFYEPYVCEPLHI